MKLALVVAAVVTACSHGEPPPRVDPPPSEPLPRSEPHGFLLPPTVLVTAVADDWSSTKVRVSVWTNGEDRLKHDTTMVLGTPEWRRLEAPFDAVVGRNGLAWGVGLHGDGAPSGHDGPVKHEGDTRSPAGAFAITRTFGFGKRYGMNYMLVDDQTECVDDPKSVAYNTIIEHTGSADWTSSEHMRTIEGYALGAVVDHNPARTPGVGSCIFLHIWDGPDSTTVGCTAMAGDDLEKVFEELGHRYAGLYGSPQLSRVVFVQLPKAEYQTLQHEWGLPAQ